MKISQPIPNPKIADYVERILVIEDVQVVNPFVLPLYANGSPTLLFQTAKGQIKNSSNNLTLFGQTVFPEDLLIKDDFTLIAYFFKPFALYALFGVSAQELTDNPIDLNLLAPAKTYEFQERLLNAPSVAIMVALLDDYVFSLIMKTKVDCELIKYATLSIAGNSSKDVLVKVQQELYLTERTFQRLFERNIGLSPNLFRRICQFNAAFQQLNNRNFNKLTDVAFDNGYADQSHFIRSFKEFTRITPKTYLNFGNQD
ncbi:helix-turn-helix domain-containing protein [Pedobacter sp. KR3-3]|uniref:Helix-turn-helix domain-containing protein n=1 Tax=Pedobacter albus TaxID=3113905 RepID=A0ABU7I3Z5_9SPHI|nr:helix-turn-helix domain-containing protein [Pedobacter sp. KR3-3]MEE1944188.1 helix-turn-helix domain-containing protein [Pedobacter sp. KR3-3]